MELSAQMKLVRLEDDEVFRPHNEVIGLHSELNREVFRCSPGGQRSHCGTGWPNSRFPWEGNSAEAQGKSHVAPTGSSGVA